MFKYLIALKALPGLIKVAPTKTAAWPKFHLQQIYSDPVATPLESKTSKEINRLMLSILYSTERGSGGNAERILEKRMGYLNRQGNPKQYQNYLRWMHIKYNERVRKEIVAQKLKNSDEIVEIALRGESYSEVDAAVNAIFMLFNSDEMSTVRVAEKCIVRLVKEGNGWVKKFTMERLEKLMNINVCEPPKGGYLPLFNVNGQILPKVVSELLRLNDESGSSDRERECVSKFLHGLPQNSREQLTPKQQALMENIEELRSKVCPILFQILELNDRFLSEEVWSLVKGAFDSGVPAVERIAENILTLAQKSGNPEIRQRALSANGKNGSGHGFLE